MPTAKSPGTLSSDTFRKFAAQSIFVDNCFNGGPGRLLKESLRWRQLGQGAIRDHGKSLHVKPLLLSSWRRRTKQCQPQDYPKAMLSLCNGIWTILPPIPLCKAFFYILKYKLLSCMILFGRKFALCLFSHFTSEELTSLGNWDWIQFEELKCLHTKELISFLASSKLATFLENCKIYSTGCIRSDCHVFERLYTFTYFTEFGL